MSYFLLFWLIFSAAPLSVVPGQGPDVYQSKSKCEEAGEELARHFSAINQTTGLPTATVSYWCPKTVSVQP